MALPDLQTENEPLLTRVRNWVKERPPWLPDERSVRQTLYHTIKHDLSHYPISEYYWEGLPDRMLNYLLTFADLYGNPPIPPDVDLVTHEVFTRSISRDGDSWTALVRGNQGSLIRANLSGSFTLSFDSPHYLALNANPDIKDLNLPTTSAFVFEKILFAIRLRLGPMDASFLSHSSDTDLISFDEDIFQAYISR